MEEFIITFRESLEAALIVGIVFSYLKKINKSEYNKFVILGILLGVFGSIISAVGFEMLLGGFTGTKEQIFEGITMIVGAVLIVYLIVWMSDKKDGASTIRRQVASTMESQKGIGLIFLVFILILREGVETTLFLSSVASSQIGISQVSSLLGILTGILVGYGVYSGLRVMNLKYLFNVSSTLLVMFAAGLFAHGIHEFQEAGVIPTLIEHVWNTNDILDENSMAGTFMKSLFGYNANPSLFEILAYFSSIVIMIIIYNRKSTKPYRRPTPTVFG